jgi:hypothetical protein
LRLKGAGSRFSLGIVATSPGVVLIVGGCVLLAICALKELRLEQPEPTPGPPVDAKQKPVEPSSGPQADAKKKPVEPSSGPQADAKKTMPGAERTRGGLFVFSGEWDIPKELVRTYKPKIRDEKDLSKCQEAILELQSQTRYVGIYLDYFLTEFEKSKIMPEADLLRMKRLTAFYKAIATNPKKTGNEGKDLLISDLHGWFDLIQKLQEAIQPASAAGG